jgi:glyoxylase I family protein
MPNPLPITRVDHVSREVTDVERTVKFYCDVLGFRRMWRPNFAFAGAWLYNGHVMIHIIEGEPPKRPDAISGRKDHVAFHTNDIGAVASLLNDHGIEFMRSTNAAGIDQIFFHDPDGNVIEVGQYPDIPRELDG